jgi:SagB-type dehydrogenase family enzyme
MEIKRSTSLIFLNREDGLVGYNIITRAEFECVPETIETINLFDEWIDYDEACQNLKELYETNCEKLVECLLSVDCLIARGSKLHRKELVHDDVWDWNVPSAILHYAVTDRDYYSREKSVEFQVQKLKSCPQPDLLQHNSNSDLLVELQRPNLNSNIMKTMSKRRTERECRQANISKKVLGDCLFAGLGITGWTHNSVGRLPLKMTPSGGARNPYEAYVFASNVDGLERGFHHYSAEQHSLETVKTAQNLKLSSLLAEQEWVENATCIVFLCANFERTMWKYEKDDNAYRVVLIEAGHIAQNIMLIAAENGFSGCPSAAITHGLVHEYLGFTKPTQSAIYAIALNKLPCRNNGQAGYTAA